MEITPDKKKLLDLIDRAVGGEITLPQFQRNFVWARDDITDLLLSVFKGYFIGTFLLLRVEEGYSPFGSRAIASLNGQSPSSGPRWLILDGQQRITSLHYVFTAPGLPVRYTKHPYRFFLRLDMLPSDPSVEISDDLVFSERADYCTTYLKPDYQFENRVVPFTEIGRWAEWQNRYERWLIEKDRDEYFDLYFPNVKPVWDNAMGGLRGFQVPVVEIPMVKDDDTNGISEICAIFEKLNSTGVRLSVFDLLTARLYTHGIDLHALWEQAVAENAKIEEFSGGDPDAYGVFVLRTIALIRREEVRAKSLINLSPKSFESDWNQAVTAIEKTLGRIVAVQRDGFGVFDPRWQPYSTLVPGLSVLLDNAEREGLGHEAYADIKCWYWGSVFLERYAGSVESTTYRDATDLLKRQEGDDQDPEVFGEIRRSILENPGFSLRSVSRVNSIYRGVMNLIAINGARDFQNNDGISFHELEDHHIFPRAFLRDKHDLKGDAVNTILNKTLITAAANHRISRKSPSQYLKEVIPEEHREQILRSHLIDPEAQAAMEQDDYEAFLKAREKDIMRFLRTYLEPAQ